MRSRSRPPGSCTRGSGGPDRRQAPRGELMQALVLAGGEGTRLRPLTNTVPKPVIPLANRPFLTYMIEWLAFHGFTEVVLSCMFLAGDIRRVLGDREWKGTRLRYVEEPEPRGTAGAVKFAEAILGERFAVLNGDILTDFDISGLWRRPEELGGRATITLMEVDDPSAYGLVLRDSGDRVSDFIEKPQHAPPGGAFVNAGAYVLEHDVLDLIPSEGSVSFEREVFPALVRSNELYGFPSQGYWLDIGTPERYLEATLYLLERSLAGDIALGEECHIASGARVGPLSVLGDLCRVEDGAVIERAVLLDRAQ